MAEKKNPFLHEYQRPRPAEPGTASTQNPVGPAMPDERWFPGMPLNDQATRAAQPVMAPRAEHRETRSTCLGELLRLGLGGALVGWAGYQLISMRALGIMLLVSVGTLLIFGKR